MTTELVSFLTTDKLELPGLLYKPMKPTKRAAVWLHGMGDNGVLYNPLRINLLGNKLNENDIALLAFNNRGAHNKKSLKIHDETLPKEKRRYQGGTHFELIADCVADIDGAVLFLAERGYDELYLLGHSSGANKIVVYDYLQKRNPFSKYVLAGAGDDSGLWYQGLGDKKFWGALSKAKTYVTEGKPQRIMPAYSGIHGFSAQSAADLIDPDGLYNSFPFYEAAHHRLGHKELFQEYKAITKPMLIVYGEYDEAVASAGTPHEAIKILKAYTSQQSSQDLAFKIISETDHGFSGKELELAKVIADWLG